jgi:hypothetical protein
MTEPNLQQTWDLTNAKTVTAFIAAAYRAGRCLLVGRIINDAAADLNTKPRRPPVDGLGSLFRRGKKRALLPSPGVVRSVTAR